MKLVYPTNIQENLDYRISIAEKCAADPIFRSIVFDYCKQDILYRFNVFVWTNDPRLKTPDLLFVTYPFQDEYIKGVYQCIINEEDNITEKSRDMGFSWMIVGIIDYIFLMHGWSSLMGSYKEDYVDSTGDMDSLFEKIRYINDRLPAWMKPHDMKSTYMNISSEKLGAVIAGDSGENFGTGGRKKVVFLDEFPLWMNGEKAFRKTRDVAKCRIFGGTPEGRFNVYGKIMTGHADYAHLAIKKFRLHWTLHPKKDQAWYENEKSNRTPLEVAKELDISYDNSVTGAVYKDYNNLVTQKKVPFNKTLPLYTARDFGLDTLALQRWQKDFKTDRLKKIASIKKVNRSLEKFCAFVTGIPTPNYDYDEEELEFMEQMGELKPFYTQHFGDPYNSDNRSVVTDTTIRDVLKKFKIILTTSRDSTVQIRIRKVTLALNRMDIDDTDYEYIHDMSQAKYPQKKENSQATTENTKPIHDSTSHHRTATEYFIDNEPIIEKKEISKVTRLVGDPVTHSMDIKRSNKSFSSNQYQHGGNSMI